MRDSEAFIERGKESFFVKKGSEGAMAMVLLISGRF